MDTTIRLWSSTADTPLLTLAGVHGKSVTDIGVIERGKHIVSSSLDGVCALWDISKQKCVQRFTTVDTAKLCTRNPETLQEEPCIYDVNGCTSVHVLEPTTFVVGTERTGIFVIDTRVNASTDTAGTTAAPSLHKPVVLFPTTTLHDRIAERVTKSETPRTSEVVMENLQ
uniref:Proteasomal ATPase-associated factor 1 n=2 Tax=Lygus hesperus TaxID=30085 RepID=A0A146M6U9_LYGHE